MLLVDISLFLVLFQTVFNSDIGKAKIETIACPDPFIRLCSYYTGYFFTSTRKAVRYSVDPALVSFMFIS